MNKIINYGGFKKAMKDGKTWVVLDCQISELETGAWYYEVEKATFYGDSSNWLETGKNAETELLAHGEDTGPEFALLKSLWENLIEKYNPDEYFVDQHDLRIAGLASRREQGQQHKTVAPPHKIIDDASVDIKTGKFTG